MGGTWDIKEEGVARVVWLRVGVKPQAERGGVSRLTLFKVITGHVWFSRLRCVDFYYLN